MPWFKNIENTNPPDIGESPRLGASRIRDWKEAVCERLKGIFYGFEPDDSEDDDTKKGIIDLPFHKQAAAPSETLDKIKLYAKEVSGVVELFTKDSGGDEVQLTSGGRLKDTFRSGDLLMSSHASAPSGFSDVSATYADKFIRISSGTPLNTGGSNTHNHGGSAGNHSLTIAQMPSHSHTVDRRTGSGAGSYNIGWNDYPASKVSGLVGSTGGGDSHNHSISSADNIPAYVQVKMYQKD